VTPWMNAMGRSDAFRNAAGGHSRQHGPDSFGATSSESIRIERAPVESGENPVESGETAASRESS
jgi:hypothetical protein